MPAHALSISDLPDGFSTRAPELSDAPAVTELVAAYQRTARGASGADEDMIGLQIAGVGSWTRRNVLVEGPSGRLAAWLSVHDRAAGRTLIEVVVSPELETPVADALATCLFAGGARFAVDIGRLRRLRATLLDSSSYDGDQRQRRWLSEAGYDDVRTWWHMSRPVRPDEATSLPGPRPGVVVRRVERQADGLPTASDLQVVHRLLEESFQDHFSSYRESFPEFVMRLREDPGHRWDHWWLATINSSETGEAIPAGAVVSSVSPPDADGIEGTYIDYIGVHRDARGHGVAKALINAVISDAAERDRNRVGLEVDADSPTRANELYESLGWRTAYVSHSWHRDIDLPT